MNRRAILWIARLIIVRAARRLPPDVRADRCREWIAELPAVIDDPDTGSAAGRGARTLWFAAGQRRACRRLARAAGPAARPAVTARIGALGMAAGMAYIVAGAWLAFRWAGPGPATPLVILIGIALVADILMAAAVGWLRRRARRSIDAPDLHM